VGVSLSDLHDAFGVDPRTTKKWAKGLKSGDAETLTRALAGRQAGRKLTPLVEHYVRLRFASIRRLIVRATNPQGNQIEVSILCDDRARPAEKIIWPMFDRWLQENDFKYLDVHFGIDQITSYQSEGYGQLAGQLEDRQMKNAHYTVLADQCGEERRHLGKLLVAKRQGASEERRRAKAIARLAALPDPDAGQRQELGRLKAGQTSARSARLARALKIALSDQRLDALNEKLKTTAREVSRLDTLIAHGAVRLCGEKKYLMDVIKITARNLFYELLAPFKAARANGSTRCSKAGCWSK
jgi:hypothetical protein